MYLNKLILLCFVGFCQCHEYYDDTYDEDYKEDTTPSTVVGEDLMKLPWVTPEVAVEISKGVLKYQNLVTDRMLSTEAKTCDEVSTVIKAFKNFIETDLRLHMTDALKMLNQGPTKRNNRKRRCIEEIKEEIEDAVKEGKESFLKCAQLASVLQDQEKTEVKKIQDNYKRSIEYSTSNLDKCLDFGSKGYKNYREQCINQTLLEIKTNSEAVSDAYFQQSKCMPHFKNNVLDCTYKVFNQFLAKKGQIETNLEKCVGYNFVRHKKDTLSSSTRNVLSHYMDSYTKEFNAFDIYLAKIYYNITITSLRVREKITSPNFPDVNAILQEHFDALDKARDENRSKGARSCYNTAVHDLENMVKKGKGELLSCTNKFLLKLKKGASNFMNILNQFNSKLMLAGNVALLKCFGSRPQDVFNTEAIAACAELAGRRITWEKRKVEIELKNLVNSLQEEQVVPNMICGDLRISQLLTDADSVLNECSKCMYKDSGDFYAVTRPSPTTIGVTWKDITTPRYNYTTTKPPTTFPLIPKLQQ